MCSEESKEKKDEETCCNPENFKGMFEMMSKCFKGEGNFDCSTIMKEMKNQSCCGPKEEDTKTGCC
jgi:hypothetical protein